MADRAIHEMVSAFAAGCMDRENFVQFKEYLQSGGELPERELGELQNIIAMIPVILDLETPDPSIKDMVAKKLIGMKDEIKQKVVNDRKTIVGTFTRVPGATVVWADKKTTVINRASFSSTAKNTVTSLSNKTEADISPMNLTDFDFSKASKESKKEKFKIVEPAFKGITKLGTAKEKVEEPKQPTKLFAGGTPLETSDSKKGASWLPAIGIILTLLLFSLLGYLGYLTYSRTSQKIDDLQNEVNSIKRDLTTANSFVANYSSLVQFFNYSDIGIVNLVSADASKKASAKVLLSFDQKEGLIQFMNVPPLQLNQFLQLWVYSKGQPYSAGVYKPVAQEYLPITSFPFLPKEQIDLYRITIETGEGNQTPAGMLLMQSENGQLSAPRGR